MDIAPGLLTAKVNVKLPVAKKAVHCTAFFACNGYG